MEFPLFSTVRGEEAFCQPEREKATETRGKRPHTRLLLDLTWIT